MVEKHVLAFFRRRHLIAPGDTVLLAASGGPDSTALLHILLELRDTLRFRVEVGHLDHGVRGPDGRADARFVAGLCERHDITFHHRAVDLSEGDGSPEDRFRRARYAFLEEAARLAGARWILTGHNEDDQAETLLLNLFRGAGPRGLGGMMPVGPGIICRPLLDVPKQAVLDYLDRREIPFRIDFTNSDTRLRRNFIRHRMLPVIEEVYEGARQVLAREAALFAEVDDFLRREARGVVSVETEAHGDAEGGEILRLDIPRMETLHPALRRAAIREAVSRLSEEPGWTAAHVEAVLSLIEGEHPSAGADLAHGVRAIRSYEEILLGRGLVAPPPPPEPVSLDVIAAGDLDWGDLRLRWRIDRDDGDPLSARRVAFDPEALMPPVILRPIRPGDRLAPWGMDGHRKVSDLLGESRVPRRERPRMAVLCDNGGSAEGERLLWLIGVRRSRHAPVAAPDGRALVIQADGVPAG